MSITLFLKVLSIKFPKRLTDRERPFRPACGEEGKTTITFALAVRYIMKGKDVRNAATDKFAIRPFQVVLLRQLLNRFEIVKCLFLQPGTIRGGFGLTCLFG